VCVYIHSNELYYSHVTSCADTDTYTPSVDTAQLTEWEQHTVAHNLHRTSQNPPQTHSLTPESMLFCSWQTCQTRRESPGCLQLVVVVLLPWWSLAGPAEWQCLPLLLVVVEVGREAAWSLYPGQSVARQPTPHKLGVGGSLASREG